MTTRGDRRGVGRARASTARLFRQTKPEGEVPPVQLELRDARAEELAQPLLCPPEIRRVYARRGRRVLRNAPQGLAGNPFRRPVCSPSPAGPGAIRSAWSTYRSCASLTMHRGSCPCARVHLYRRHRAAERHSRDRRDHRTNSGADRRRSRGSRVPDEDARWTPQQLPSPRGASASPSPAPPRTVGDLIRSLKAGARERHSSTKATRRATPTRSHSSTTMTVSPRSLTDSRAPSPSRRRSSGQHTGSKGRR